MSQDEQDSVHLEKSCKSCLLVWLGVGLVGIVERLVFFERW
jgi:hypothetical protein